MTEYYCFAPPLSALFQRLTRPFLLLAVLLLDRDCVESLRSKGYRVVASDLKPHKNPIPIQDFDWSSSPVAVVFGNELTGITEEMCEACDHTFYVPMVGLADSFNLSVGSAITLSYLKLLGGIKPGDLTEKEREKLLLRWIMKSVRGSIHILRREGFDLPKNFSLATKVGGYITK